MIDHHASEDESSMRMRHKKKRKKNKKTQQILFFRKSNLQSVDYVSCSFIGWSERLETMEQKNTHTYTSFLPLVS